MGVGLAVITKEFRYVFQLFFRPYLSPIYSSGQNKVPTAKLKSRLIVVQKSFDSRLIVVL